MYSIALVLSLSLNLQAVTAVAPQVVGQNSVIASQRVTATLDGVTLETALREIERQSGNKLIFGADIVPLDRKVSLQANHITAIQALAQVLRGTNIETRVAPTGEIALVRSSKANSAIAQGVITGRVVDTKSGKAVSGANVSLDQDTRGVISDENGVYQINNISAGIHTIIVRLVGYAKQTRSVNVGDGATVTVDFKLEPSASVLDQVVVTGTVIATELKAVPNAITVITAKQIEERGITRIDQLFRGDVPGLFAMNRGSESLLDDVIMFSRGATTFTSGVFSSGTSLGTNPIKTYIDGIEMADSKYLSQIDPTSIERIEILTGPQASTIYGAGAINGVMQIFTKKGTTSRPQLNLNLASGIAQNNFSNHLAPNYVANVNVSGVEGRMSYSLGGSWNYTGSWTPSKRTQRLSSNAGTSMNFGKFTVDVSARRGLTQNRQGGRIEQGQTRLREAGIWTSLATTGIPSPTISALVGQTLSLSSSFRPFSWWSHSMDIGSDVANTEKFTTSPTFSTLSGGGGDTLLSIQPSSTSRTSQHYTTTLQLPISSFSILNLTMGGDHWSTKGLSGQVNVRSLTGIMAKFGSTYQVNRTRPTRNSGAFVQGQLSVKDALFITYGIRADWNPSFGDKARVLPGRYGMSYVYDVGLLSIKLLGSYGTSIRPPIDGQALGVKVLGDNVELLDLFGPLYFQLPNPELLPEDQKGSEGGVELYLGSRASLTVTRYNQTVGNLIYLVGGGNAGGVDSVRSLTPPNSSNSFTCSSPFRDAGGYCYKYQQQYLNVGSIRNQGWELKGSINLGPLTTDGTYSWTKSRVIGITPRYKTVLGNSSDFQVGNSFTWLPEHTWKLGLAYSYAATSLSLSINGIGVKYLGQGSLNLAASSASRLILTRPRMELLNTQYRPMASGYATADLIAVHHFSSNVEGTLQVNNLTNYYQNDRDAIYASIGRQTKIGARIRLN